MASRPTLLKLADEVISESRVPFSIADFEKSLKERWNRRIADSTLDRLKRRLANHGGVIAVRPNGFLSCRAVLERIRHIPLAVTPDPFEVQQGIFVPGCRLVPFVPPGRTGEDLTFLDPEGGKVPHTRRSFYLEDVIHYFRYSEEVHFPDRITVNEHSPGKSVVTLNVCEVGGLLDRMEWKRGDSLCLCLEDYDRGVFRIRHYPRRVRHLDRLRVRSLYVAMEASLAELCGEEDFHFASLEKQLLRVFFTLNEPLLDVPAFSLADLAESLESVQLVGFEEGGPHFVPAGGGGLLQFDWEAEPRVPRGRTGSLDQILEDMALPFNGAEFQAILNTVLGSKQYQIDSIFDFFFAGRDGRFYDRKQRNAFYRHVRRLLAEVFQKKRNPEPKMVAELRDRTVRVKLSLIEILRYLETSGVSLADLPGEILDQVIDLDNFCSDVLPKFADPGRPPDLKSLRYIRMALNIIQANLDQVEEEIYYHLGIY